MASSQLGTFESILGQIVPGSLGEPEGNTFTADAYILFPGALSADAFILGYVYADAVLSQTMSGSFTADADLERTFSADACIFYELIEKSFTADAVFWIEIWNDNFNRANESSVGDPYIQLFDTEVRLESNTLLQPPDLFTILRGFQQIEYLGLLQFDFYTGSSTGNNLAFIELDGLGGTDAEGIQFWPYVAVSNSDGSTGWEVYTGESPDTYAYTFAADTWCRVKAIFLEDVGYVKAWPVADPEPDWQHSYPRQSAGFPDPDDTGFEIGGRFDAFDLLIDNLYLASPTPGVLRFAASFTTAAIIKRTQEFGAPSSTPVTVRGAASNASGSGSMSFGSIPGATSGDFAIGIGVVNGNVPQSQIGTFRGTIFGPVFTLAAYVSFPSLSHTYGVWYAKVHSGVFGFPSIVWDWTGTNHGRIGMWLIVLNSREMVRVSSYEDTTPSDAQTIPPGTAEFLLPGTLAIPTFAATANNLTAFDVPINTIELTDRSRAIVSTLRLVLETSAANEMASGGNPSWTANSVGADAAARSLIIEVPPVSGILAYAFLKGNAVFADAYLVVAPGTAFPVLWADHFDDRITEGDWGPPVWQALPNQGTGLQVDGAVAIVTATDQVLTGYPVVSENSSYEFDILFTTRTASNRVSLQSLSTTGLAFTLTIDGIGDILLNAVGTSIVLDPNQWYSVRLKFYADRLDLYVWRRDGTDPGVPTLSAGTIAAPSFVPRLSIGGATETQLDNFIVRSLASPWRRLYVFTAAAVIKKSKIGFLFPEAELLRGGRLACDARITNSGLHTFTTDAILVTYKLLFASAELVEDTRARHQRDGPEHTGVDHGIDHLLAATIEGYLAGTNLHDLLVDIDARLSELEAQ